MRKGKGGGGERGGKPYRHKVIKLEWTELE